MKKKYPVPTVVVRENDFEEKPWFYVESARGFLSEKEARRRPAENRKRFMYRIGAPREVYRNGHNQWVHPVSEPEQVEGDEETCIIVGGQDLTMTDLSALSQEMAEKRARRREARTQKRASSSEVISALKDIAAMKIAAGRGRKNFALLHSLDGMSTEVVRAMADVAREGTGM